MKKKPKKLTEVQKLRRALRESNRSRDHFKMLKERFEEYYSNEQRARQDDNKHHTSRYTDLQREKETYYRESNQKTTKIARLERAVTSLKEGAQKILLAFDTLG